ncbi:unnamed protein product [Brassica rapa subsp. narinosa]
MSTTTINSKDTVRKEEKTVEIVSTMVEEVMVVKDHIIHNGGSGRKNSGDDDKKDGSADSVEE